MDDSVKRALNAYKLSSKRNDNYTTDKAVLSALELYEKKRNYTAEDKVKSIQERLEQEISNYNSYIASPISHGYGESAAKDTLEAQRKSRINIGNLRRELDAYRDFVGDGYNDAISSLDSLSKGYDSALDYAQSFSQWKTEDDYKEALRQEEAHKKARTELLNLDLGSAKKDLDYYENSFNAITNSQTEINRLKGELNKYKLAQAKGGNVSKEVAEIERKIAVHQKAIDDFLKGGTVKDLEKFIESKKLYYNEAESYQKMVAEAKELEKIMASPDFMGDAQKGYEKFLADEKTRAAQNEKSWWEVALEGMGQNPDMSMPAAGLTQVVNNYRNDRSYMLPNETWSDEDKNLFGYYYLQDRNKAFDFAEATNNEINRTQKEERLKGLEESTTSNWYTNLGYQGLAILGNATGIVDYLDNILEFNARGTITEKNYASAFEQAQTIRNTTAEYLNDKGGTISEDVPILGGKGWGDAYQLGTSVADSMITANALGPYGTAVVFFGSAGASAVDDALDRGATPLEAVKYGTLMGAAEAFAEYIGADKLLKIGSSKVPKQFFMNVLKQGGAEGIEEGVTSVLGQFADNLVMADKSEFNTRIKEYMIYQGMSYDEAVKKAWAELAESVAYDTLAGFASGNISGGIQTSANTIKGRKATGNTIKEKGMTSALADMGKTFGENSKVAKMSSKITDKSSAYSLGGLYDRVSYEIGKENQSDIADLLVMRGMTTEDAQSTSKWLVKAVNGEELTKNQQKALNENPIISSVFDEVSNSIFTVDDRLNLTDAVKKSTSNDVLSDKINEANADKYKLKQIAEEAARKQFGLNKVTSIETDTMLDSMVNDAVNMAKESKYKSVVGVIAEGNKVSKEDGVSVKKVASVGKDGTIMVELNDGTVADSDDIVYKSDDDAVMYISTANLAKELNSLGISFDTTSANAVAKGYNPISGVSASTYMLGAEEAIRYGVIGYNRDSIRKDSYYHKLTKPQQDYLYQIGRDIAEKSTKKENSGKASATSNKSKKGKVTKAIKSKLKDSQQTAISTVEKLSKAGILKNNFYFFESVDGTTVVKGREVKARVLSEDIGAYKKGSLAPNGIHVTASGDIYIDINAGNSAQGIALYTLAHELGHFVKEQNAEGFKVLADFVADKLGGKFETLIQEKLDLWDELGRTEFNYMDAYEDVVCDALEPMFTDGNLAEKLVEYSESSSKGKSLLKTLKEFFSNLYKRIQKAYAQLEPDDPAAQIIKENQKSVEKLADLFAKAIVGANENFVSSDIQAQKNTTDEGDVSFSIREDFYNQLDNWDGETTGFSFVIGTTSEALLEAGIPDKQIRWDSSKIKALLNKHNGMTIETVREIPELLEHPVVVIDSKNNKNSRIVMGDLHDKNGKIVTTVLLLTPTSRKGNQLDIIKVSSAQGRGHIESLFKNEDGSNVPVRFVDKKRIQNWLNANRLQLPLHSFNLDSNNIILTPVEKVKENFGKDSEQDIAEATLEENGIVVDSSTKSASLSVRYLLGDAQKTKVAKSLAVRFGVTEKEALNWLTAETSLSSLILNPKYSQYLDYEADPDEVAIKQNSDYPQGTVDFSPICAKRREFTSVMNNILRLFPNHVFAATDLAKIRTIMQEEGMTIPCGICYVEDRRQLDTIVAQDFIDGLKLYREGSKTRPDGKPFNANQLKGLQLTDGDTYVPSVYELVSLEGRNKLKAKNPNMEAAWVKYNNARGMQAVRLLANEAEYKRQILDYSKSTVKAKNDKGGLRIYSFSDAEMFHLIDIIQVITDSSAVGLCLQGYTKVNEYAKAVKDTGEKLNRSLIPKGELGYHMENGKVVLDYDTVEGIDINSKDFFDNRDNPNVGNITIGVSDVQIRAAMVSDFVDQIIPFHTGQSAEVLGENGIATWTNYKDFQAEKDISTGKKSEHQINIYTEVLQVLEKEGTPITKRSFVEKFLQVCKENELTPRFSQFLNTNENGEYIYTEGYHKMLVDFKTFAQTEVGEYLPQMPVKPIFDNEYITNLLNDYVGSQKVKDAEIAKSMPKVVERITNEIINPSEKGQKFSDRTSNKALASMDDIALYIKNTDKANYIGMIFNGTKTEETRSTRTLDAFIGKDFYVTDGKYAYGSIVLGEPHKYTEAEFHKLENQRKHRVPKGDKYDVKPGGTKWAYPIESYSKFDKPKKLSESKEYMNSFQARQVKYSDRDYMDAVKNGDIETAQRMVDEATKEAGAILDENGNPLKLYRGTMGGQTVFSKERTLNGKIYTIDNIDVATKYGDKSGKVTEIAYQTEGEKVTYALYGFSKNMLTIDAQNGVWSDLVVPEELLQYSNGRYKATNAEIAEWAEKAGYDALQIKNVRDGSFDMGNEIIFFNENLVKSADPITYDDNGNVIPLSQRFNAENEDIRYSDRDYRLNSRNLLANALESTTTNPTEREWLARYKAKIASLNADQERLDEINAEIKEISFTKGSDRSKLTALYNNKKTLTNRITKADKKLLEIESADVLKKVLEVEKQRAIEKIKAQAREDMKAEKAESAKTVRELMDRYTERIKNSKEGRDKTALRHKIIKVVKDLNNLLLKPTKERHIPEEMRIAVAEALSIVNMDTADAENRVAKYNELIAKATDPDVIASLTETRDRILTQGDKLSEKLGRLKEAYGMIRDSADEYTSSIYDDVIYSKIETVQKKVGNTPIRNMSMAQLESVYDLYTMVLTSVRDSNKAFAEDLKMTRLEIGSNVFGEIKDHNKARDRIKHPFIEKFGWQNLKPMQAMKTIGSSILQKLWNNVLYGQEVFAQDYDEAVKFAKEMKEKHGYDKWDLNKLYSFESKSGKAMKINLEQMMSVYAYSKRHQADEHIEYGGIVLNEGVIKEKNKLGKVVEVKVNDSTAYRLNKLQIAEIIKTLEEDFPGAKEFVDEMQKYLSETMGEKGNEVSMKMYGIKLFKEEHYFPLKSSKDFMEAANAKLKGDVKIKNKGMTKSTVEHAKNPIVLEGFLDVWGNHINEMAMYHGLVLPLEDFSRALNYGFKADDKLNTDAESVRTALHDAFGDYADNYLNELLKAINGGVLHDSSAEFADKMISKFKKAKVMASLSVIIQQPTAIIRAMGIIEPKYFTSQNFHHKQTWEELKKYCPTAIIKETGSFDTNMGRTIVDMVKDDRGFTDKVGDFLGKAPAYMDEMGWNMIWRALKNKVATEQKLSGEELLKECGKQMTLILNETQVYDSVMARSELMRSKNTLTKMATAFMAEPSTVANMIYGAVLDFKRGKKDVATKTVAATIASVVINGLVSSLVYAFRDDDDDETFLEKYASAATTEVLDGLNPLTYIPFVKDAWSLFQGYKVERTDMALVSDVVDAINKFYKVFDSDAYEGMSSGETTEYIYDNLKPLLTSICDLFGLPVGNVLRDAEALITSVFNDNTESKGMGEAFKEGVLNSRTKILRKIVEDMESNSK